jgi:ABC-type arginine transport system permease subunit
MKLILNTIFITILFYASSHLFIFLVDIIRQRSKTFFTDLSQINDDGLVFGCLVFGVVFANDFKFTSESFTVTVKYFF